eukprot:scaffold2190_cov72-Cylindrotheca_fusiformis.AAC.7
MAGKEDRKKKHHRSSGEDEKQESSRSSKRRHRHADEDDEDDKDRDRRRRHHSRRHESEEDSHKRKKQKKSRHDEDRKKRKHRDDSDDDGSGEDDRKRERKHRSSSKKRDSEKRRHRDKKDKKEKKDKRPKLNRPDKSRLYPLGPTLGRKPDTLIDPVDDYFTLHEQYWVYLYREEGVAFNDLTSDEAREGFKRFAKEYNAGNLEAEYYSTKMPAPVLEESKTTKHSWSFNNNMTDTEKKGLQTLQEGIWKQTEYNSTKGPPQNSFGQTASGDFKAPPVASAEGSKGSRKTPEERLEERRSNKRLRSHVRTVEEELQGGPKDFRERQLEKKRQHADRIHGASRAKDEGAELSDKALFGGDDETDRYKAALAREKDRKAKRTDARASRIQELQEKDKDRQENMLQMLGLKNLKPGQKITITPREN